MDKLLWKHNVTTDEAEQVFSGSPRFRFIETGDIDGEDLYASLDQTEAGRYRASSSFTRRPVTRWLSAPAR